MGTRLRCALRWGLTFGGATLLFLVVALWQATAAAAATITVTDANDTTNTGDGISLREAITSINNQADLNSDVTHTGTYGTNDSIVFNIPGFGVQTITVGSALPSLTRNMTVDGTTQPGYPTSNIVVDGNSKGSVFTIGSSGVGATFKGLTIQHGNGNTCVTICTGGIDNNAGGTVNVSNSTFSGNTNDIGGGGIYNWGTLTVTNSTFSNNTSVGGSGGSGIFNHSTLTVTNSTFSGNGGGGCGGGISNVGGIVHVANSTIVGNATTCGGGGVYNADGTITLTNTILASNTGPGANCFNNGGTITDGGHNVEFNPTATCGFSAGTDLFTDPLLGTLGNYGGPTQTIPLNAGSPAIDAGDDATCTASGAGKVNGVDQRGVHRPQGAHCDIGAFEYVAAYSTVVNTTADDGSVDIARCAPGNANTCRLADAVAVVDGNLGSSTTITFDSAVFPANSPKTITVINPYFLTLTTATITVDGSNHMVVLDGANMVGFFGIDPNVTATINGLTMQHGASSDGGGAIFNFGTLTVQNCTFDTNNGFFASGGAIENLNNLAAINSTFTNNTAGDGGAIDSENGTLAIVGSTFQNNHAVQPAFTRAPTTKSSRPKMASRSVRTADSFTDSGGALFLCSCSSPMIIVNSTFTGNTATTNGGAILTEAPLTTVNVTIIGNSANSGGGIFVSAPDGGTLTAVNALIAGNTLTGSGGAGTDVNGVFAEASKNDFIGDGSTTGLTNGASGNQVGTTASPLTPLVGPLGKYGGPTQTIPLLPGSPAIDTGADTGCSVGPVPGKVGRQAPGPIDQRGVPRPQGLHCDIGAFESQGFTLTPSGTPQSTQINTQFAQPLGVTVTPKNAGDPVAGGVITFTVTPAGSGASATLSTLLPVAINGSGVANVTATANGVVGSYTASASSAGAAPVTFNLTNTNFLVSLVVTYNGSTTPTIKVGQIAPFVATATYSDGTHVDVTQEATWSSDNTTFATVVNAVGQPTNGQVTGVVPNGTVPLHIGAVFGNLTGQATVTVAPPTGMAIVIPPAPGSRPSGVTSGSGTTPNPAPSPPPPTQNGGTSGPAPAPVPGSR